MSPKTTKKLRSSGRSSRAAKPGNRGKRKQKTLKYRTWYIAGAALFLGIIFAAVLFRCSSRQIVPGEIRNIEIAHGSSVHDISLQLRREGIISSAWGFRRHVRRHELDRTLQAGTYHLPAGLSVSEAADILVRGFPRYADILVYPGLTVEEISQRIADWTDASQRHIRQQLEREAEVYGFPFAEGFFFPGTYRIPLEGFTPSLVIREAFNRFTDWRDQHADEIAESPYTLEQIVITASMIQREAGSIEEMPIIADIIWKRLELGMPLGIDATTRYELNDWQNALMREDLERATPYNTRRNIGLPPTGISNPGVHALLAALRPEDSPYLYFLHDRNGKIHYGRTYQEHQQNIEQHLRR